MCENEDVLTRLDTLLGSPSGPDSVNSNTSSTSSTPSSILKTSPSQSQQKKSLRFREETQLQEVIGYGGEESCNSSDSEGEMETEKSEDIIEELTVEEKNVLNLTRQNTTFNAHAQNLNTETNNAPLLRLGVDKKVTPIITVSSIFLACTLAPSKITVTFQNLFFCTCFVIFKFLDSEDFEIAILKVFLICHKE